MTNFIPPYNEAPQRAMDRLMYRLSAIETVLKATMVSHMHLVSIHQPELLGNVKAKLRHSAIAGLKITDDRGEFADRKTVDGIVAEINAIFDSLS